jgi:transcriptional regulator with XRE-family HTH domain
MTLISVSLAYTYMLLFPCRQEVVFINIREILAHNVRLYRTRLELTQEELALKCMDVNETEIITNALSHRSYISDIESCRRNVSLDKIGILAEVLMKEPYELFLTQDRIEIL